jgi:hypothetical protein
MRIHLAWAAVVVLSAAVIGAMPQAASASPPLSYRLTHGTCRKGYVRQVRHVKQGRRAWCVTATETQFNSFGEDATVAAGDKYFGFAGQVSYSHESAFVEEAKITATIRDATKGTRVGSFATGWGCWIFSTTEGDKRTFVGREGPPPNALSGGPDPACPVSVSAPIGDQFRLVLAFAGNSSFVASMSKEAPFMERAGSWTLHN